MKLSKLSRFQGLVLLAGVAFTTSQPCAAEELRIGYPSDIVSEDPADYRHRWTEILLRNQFDGLLTRDPSMRLVPELVESWHQASHLVYEFRLRSGIRTHDGQPLTADQVVFSFNRLIKPGALNGRDSPRKGLLGPLSSVTATGPLTVRMELDAPWPIFPAMLPFQQIVVPRSGTGTSHKNAETSVGDWIGTGPFKLVARFPGEALIFDRNEYYFGGATDIPPVGPSCVDRVVINVIEDNESRVAGLLAGDFDLVVDIKPHSIPVIAKHANTDVHVVDGTRSFFLAMNNRKPPFDDVRVRHAVAHALDRKELVGQLMNDRATLIDGILGPGVFGKNKHLHRYEYNPGRARELLAEAGFPNGLDLKVDVTRQLFPVAEAIGVQLARAGIRAQTIVSETADIKSKWHSGTAVSAGQLWLTSWGGAAMDPVGIFDATHRSGGRGNAAGYSNPELDSLLDRAGSEYDKSLRAEIYQQAEAIVNRELPYAYLWVPQEIYGVSSKVSGFAAARDGRLNLQDVCASR